MEDRLERQAGNELEEVVNSSAYPNRDQVYIGNVDITTYSQPGEQNPDRQL
jgi:hypothetical protein